MSSESFSGLVLMSCHGQGVGVKGMGWVGTGGTLEERGVSWRWFMGGLGPGVEVVLSLVL